MNWIKVSENPPKGNFRCLFFNLNEPPVVWSGYYDDYKEEFITYDRNYDYCKQEVTHYLLIELPKE